METPVRKLSVTCKERKLLCCPICSMIFDNPKLLTCGHSLCQCCILEVSYRKGSVVACPECRHECTVPENGLPTNFVLQRLVDEVSHEDMKEKVVIEATNFRNRALCVSEKLTTLSDQKSPESMYHFEQLIETINSLVPAALKLKEQSEKKDNDWCIQVIKNLEKLTKVLQSIVATVDEACMTLNDELHTVNAVTAMKILDLNYAEENLFSTPIAAQLIDGSKINERRRKLKFDVGMCNDEDDIGIVNADDATKVVLDVVTDDKTADLLTTPIPQCILIIGGGQADLKSFELYFPDEPTRNVLLHQQPLVGRFGPVCGSTPEKMFIAGGAGMKSTDIFDLDTLQWSKGPDMSVNRFAAASAMFQQELFVFGGTGLPSAEVLKAEYTQWSAIASMPQEVAYSVAVNIESQIYLLGGCNELSDYGPSLYCSSLVYTPSSDQWSVSRPLPYPRKNVAAVATGQTMVVCGGEDEYSSTVNTCHRFDPRSGIWMNLATMNDHRRAHALVNYKDSLIAIGGTNGGRLLDTVEQYDPYSDNWFYIDPIKMERDFFAAVCV